MTAVACAAVLLCAGCSSHAARGSRPGTVSAGGGSGAAGTASPADNRYGSFPSFLPKDTLRPDGPLVGTAQRAALTVQGATVDVRLTDARVQAIVAGPQVPDEGTPYQSETTVGTWTVTLRSATRSIPVRLRDFSILDDRGQVHIVRAVAHEAQPPAAVAPGRPASFAIRSVVPTGEGLVRWAPGGGPVVASWDFVAETD